MSSRTDSCHECTYVEEGGDLRKSHEDVYLTRTQPPTTALFLFATLHNLQM